ncbi:hypothetical protein EN850_08980 [Mesorhizobium sp. M8A.F.Ca.ET.207.01.1.1]|nr:hypothetical protein EN850_08980 [Mesorhizobium sp. M8A.F.Ca.ET.207.01.1.1]
MAAAIMATMATMAVAAMAAARPARIDLTMAARRLLAGGRCSCDRRSLGRRKVGAKKLFVFTQFPRGSATRFSPENRYALFLQLF